MNVKETNPKDAIGTGKVPFSVVPLTVIAEVALGMLEGARKYGRHNYRVAGVRASVYIDAAMRHCAAWWEGEDIDPGSKLSHITKAIASLTVLRDAMIQDNWVDDRPPASPPGWIDALNAKAAEIVAMYPDPVQPYTASNAHLGLHKPAPAQIEPAPPPRPRNYCLCGQYGVHHPGCGGGSDFWD